MKLFDQMLLSLLPNLIVFRVFLVIVIHRHFPQYTSHTNWGQGELCLACKWASSSRCVWRSRCSRCRRRCRSVSRCWCPRTLCRPEPGSALCPGPGSWLRVKQGRSVSAIHGAWHCLVHVPSAEWAPATLLLSTHGAILHQLFESENLI